MRTFRHTVSKNLRIKTDYTKYTVTVVLHRSQAWSDIRKGGCTRWVFENKALRIYTVKGREAVDMTTQKIITTSP
jgi:hypothetical protein